MQQEKNQIILEELNQLEALVKPGSSLPNGSHELLTSLTNRYPRHFIQFMEIYWDRENDCPAILRQQQSTCITYVDLLSKKLEHLLVKNDLSDEEKQELQSAAGKLENLLWLRNFSEPQFTHFLDINQATDYGESYGIESLFYRIEGAKLHICVTGWRGDNFREQTFPIRASHKTTKAILSGFLLKYFSTPGNYYGDQSYCWSNMISRQHYLHLQTRGWSIISRKKKKAALLGENNPLITYCREQGLNPRPAGGYEKNWIANCPSRGNHSIMISILPDEWGCGYCRKKGGLEELEEWMRSRKSLGK